MSERDDGGPAFPRPHGVVGELTPMDGMTLRDYFAAKALPWALARDYGNDWGERGVRHLPLAAKAAYKAADAMLLARKEGSHD